MLSYGPFLYFFLTIKQKFVALFRIHCHAFLCIENAFDMHKSSYYASNIPFVLPSFEIETVLYMPKCWLCVI